MPEITLTFVKSFTQDPLQGNPVAVCLSQENLSDEIYFKITKQTGFSECVFIKFNDNIPTLRFFSPEKEMNMCGHATLASAHILKDTYNPTIFKTKAGDVTITYQPDGLIEMLLKAEPLYYTDFVPTNRIAELLGIDMTAIKNTPVKISVGTPKVLIELRSTEDLWTMKPNFTAIATEIPQGIYPFVRINENLYYARQFNPATGINEDPVTGVAAGALGVHLKNKNINRFTVEQGHILNKKGTIFVDVTSGVKIGGYATIFNEILFKI
jgi:PhzF family phenazine biosynthesis protein